MTGVNIQFYRKGLGIYRTVEFGDMYNHLRCYEITILAIEIEGTHG